jgi:hypothetical protein
MGLVRRCDWRITYQEYPTVFSTSARGVPARRVARDAEVTVNMAFALPAVGEVATRIVVPRRTPDFDGLKHRFAEQDAISISSAESPDRLRCLATNPWESFRRNFGRAFI